MNGPSQLGKIDETKKDKKSEEKLKYLNIWLELPIFAEQWRAGGNNHIGTVGTNEKGNYANQIGDLEK